MKVLFLYIAFFLACLQVSGNQVTTRENVVFLSDVQNDNQDKDSSTDNDDEEIVFIPGNCLPVFFTIQPEETIYTYIIGLKASFSFSLWRPPRI